MGFLFILGSVWFSNLYYQYQTFISVTLQLFTDVIVLGQCSDVAEKAWQATLPITAAFIASTSDTFFPSELIFLVPFIFKVDENVDIILE